jgi:predicted transposase/invertase (TIGR01784 family)
MAKKKALLGVAPSPITKFLDPKNDYAFRKIFGSEKNKEILIHFLNDVLTFKERAPIKDLVFLKTIQDPETASKKASAVDVMCTDEKDNRYIVEMQVAPEKGFEKRAQYYASKAYVSQILIGGKYHDLKEIIFLAIADFIMFPNKKHWKSEHITLDKDSYEHDLKDFSFTFLELPKFHNTIDELPTLEEKWMYYFKHAEETSDEDLKKLIEHAPIIERAYEELDRFHWNDEEIRTYEKAEKDAWDYIAVMDFQYDKGLEEGRKEKEAAVKKEKIETAKVLLLQGINIGTIAKATRLSAEEIKALLP